MSHFYGTIDPNNGRPAATKCGHKGPGLTTHTAGWQGAIRVHVWHDEDADVDRFEVQIVPWQGSEGSAQVLARGELDASAERARHLETYQAGELKEVGQ